MIISTQTLVVVIAITAVVLLIWLGTMLMKRSFLLLVKGRAKWPIETDKLCEGSAQDTHHPQQRQALVDETAASAARAAHRSEAPNL